MILQEIGSNNCGQCCLATILEISLKEAERLVGHNDKTKSKELTRHFNSGKNVRGAPEDDGLCILRYKKFKDWHWIVKMGDQIYDPLYGRMYDIKDYFIMNPEHRITSHFPIRHKYSVNL